MNSVRSLVGRSNAMAAQLGKRIIEGNMTSTVRITRGGDEDPAWDPVTKKVVVSDPTVIWEPSLTDEEAGIAGIQTVTGPVTMALADEPQYFQSTYVTIPVRAPQPNVDDIVEVVTCPDANLVGRFYRVVDVESPGQISLRRRMQVVGIQPSKTWRQP